MWRVEILLSDEGQLSEYLTEMRQWLDRNRFEPSTFLYDVTDDCRIIRVDFKVGSEAELFAEHFGGKVSRPLVG